MSQQNDTITTQGQNASTSTTTQSNSEKENSDRFTDSELISAIGYGRWQKLSALQIEAAREIHRSEIDAADVSAIFGPNGDGAKANRVALNNVVRYALLRQKATREGLVQK